jgi:flagellar basal-body rod protein FlgG
MLVGPYPYSTWHTYLGTLAQESRLDIIANNMANVTTPGFKRDVPIFEGYMVKASKTDFSQGHFEQTENKLDLALSGPGFFQVETPNGIRYTRDGSFTRNAEGQIVTLEGNPLVGAGIVPNDVVDLNITEDGRIFADDTEIGQVEMVEFDDPSLLAKEGHNNFVPKTEGLAGKPAENTTVAQGFVEKSNIDPVMESINLIDTLRTYEVFQKVVQTFQEADQKTINEVGRLI